MREQQTQDRNRSRRRSPEAHPHDFDYEREQSYADDHGRWDGSPGEIGRYWGSPADERDSVAPPGEHLRPQRKEGAPRPSRPNSSQSGK